jgi:hypothetical protein
MNLSKMTKNELVTSLKTSVGVEKKAISDVLSHLLEMDRRKIYCEKGYDSLYTYLTREKLYSDSEAATRIAAMRLVKKLPQITKKLKNNSISLTRMASINRFITNENKGRKKKISKIEAEQIIDAVADKTCRESKVFLDEIALVEPQLRMIKIKADKILNKKIDSLMKLLGNEMSEQNLFEHLIDQKLAELKKSNKPRKSNLHSRYISQNIQDQVKKRSQNRCEHFEKGARCNGVYRLYFDHKIPFSKGGKSDFENIQHLCAQHNWHKSDKLL